jgi:hypothetical protein
MKLALGLVLAAFTAVSCYVTWQEGYWGFLHLARRELWGAQVFGDLCISLFLLLGFLRRDAAERGLPFWPLVLGTVFLGSIAPMTYLLVRNRLGAAPVAPADAAA